MNCHLVCRTEHTLYICRPEVSDIQAITQQVAGKNKQEKEAITANKESCCMLNKAFYDFIFLLEANSTFCFCFAVSISFGRLNREY